MKKWVWIIFLIIILILIYKIYNLYIIKHASNKEVDIFPKIEFKGIQNNIVNSNFLKPHSEIILTYFNTECNHCQEEFAQLIENYNQIKQFNIILVSSQNIEELKKFYYQNNLSDYPDILLLGCDYLDLQHYLGNPIIPSTWIYGENGKMIKKYSGEVSLSIILSVLKNDKK